MTDSPKPDVNLLIRGELVGLGPLRGDLLTTYVRWMNDLRVTRALVARGRIPMTGERQQAWLNRALTGTEPIFTIYVLEDMRPIGTTNLYEIDYDHQRCEFGIVIGDRDAWGHGYGTETTRLMLQYAFDVLGMRHVMLTVHADNPGGIRAYERAGFRQAGRLRNVVSAGRRRIDEIIMDAVPEDLEPSYLDRVMHRE